MSTTVPTQFQLLPALGGQIFGVREPISAATGTSYGLRKIVRNATYAYAVTNRRSLLSWGTFGDTEDPGGTGRNPITTTVASGSAAETIFEDSVNLSANTDNLSLICRGEGITVEVTVWGVDDKTISLVAWTPAGLASGVEGDITSGPSSVSKAATATIEVKVKKTGAATAKLFAIRVYEMSLATADLP